MRKPDPPFPSFTLAMTQWDDSMRLPSYRESLVVRYHPYARKEPKPAERYMAVPRHPSGAIYTTNATDAIDEVASNLDRALNREAEDGVELKRRRSLTSLIIDLALAVIDSYRNSRVGKKTLSVAKN
ncbi:hypothetical protein PYCCODRAFT_1195034 [Trametes coccinea BRFM310]|uniref:Uncharacterized protein n=1 Tax=Trametes coccinea (strain BRFM310) TaxID=1353009 RepID=A0A1Y2I9R2_TRAC3|nr:hypothetical protein PYCCODRAFT_1195034 [Trametes coccinea BRFM310]